MTGSELKELYSASTPEGQRRFYDEYKNYVYTIVYSRLKSCGKREDIEECVSDIFAELLSDAERLFAMDDLTGITRIIAVRKAIQMYRRLTGKNIVTGELDDSIPDSLDVQDESEKMEKSRIILSRIKELGEPDSEIIILSYYYGLNSMQIGRRLSISPAYVRKRKQRALKRLKELLSGSGISEE